MEIKIMNFNLYIAVKNMICHQNLEQINKKELLIQQVLDLKEELHLIKR